MAKEKVAKGVTNKHLHARTTFLFQAASYLTLEAGVKTSYTATTDPDALETPERKGLNLATHLTSHLRAVSRKGQTRLSADLKRTICKSCDSILIPGRTSTQYIENQSKGGKKPWADVMFIQCNVCHSTKRFPVGAERQQRKTKRTSKAPALNASSDGDPPASNLASEVEHSTTPVVPTSTLHTPGSD